MFKREVLDQSGFLFSKKDSADESPSVSSSQDHHVKPKYPDLKLWVSDLLTIKGSESTDFYSFCGFIVNTVDIYGVVTQVCSNRFGVLYSGKYYTVLKPSLVTDFSLFYYYSQYLASSN